jgi:hypothetical protein
MKRKLPEKFFEQNQRAKTRKWKFFNLNQALWGAGNREFRIFGCQWDPKHADTTTHPTTGLRRTFVSLFQEATDQVHFFAFVTSFLTTGVCYLKTEEIRALNSSLDLLSEGISCPFLFASKQPRLR